MNTKLTGTDRPIALYYAFPSDIASIFDVDSNTKRVTFNEGKGWNLINTTIGTISFSEVPGKKDKGTMFDTSVSASCPGHEISTPSAINDLSGRRVYLRIDYKSGYKKLIGNQGIAPRVFLESNSNDSTFRKFKSNYESSQTNYWLE